jgi:hypothetical protein
LSSVIAYPVMGLGYTILRLLFNVIFKQCLTKRPLNDAGSNLLRGNSYYIMV